MNVIAPLLLTRLLVPALKAAGPKGKVIITTGGSPIDTVNVKNLYGDDQQCGLPAYSHSKRVMEAMSFGLSKELAKSGIVLNIVGGDLPGGERASERSVDEEQSDDLRWRSLRSQFKLRRCLLDTNASLVLLSYEYG